MGPTFDRRTLLIGGAAAAAGIAGASLLDFDDLAGATTNGPGLNGISTKKPKRGGSLVFGVDAEEQGFNPTTARFDEVGVMYARTVFDPLTIVTASGGWEPYLAESVTPNADYSSWTITVRPNVVFHDGTPCDGAALLTNFQAQKASLLVGIVLDPILESITQSGPNSVTLNFKTPWAPFPLYLAGGIGGQPAYMCAPAMLSAPNGGTANPVGTGPFKFKEWIPNDHFTATANPHYWRPGLPYLDQITFKPIIDDNARAEALRTGTIDIMVTGTPQIITQFRGNKKYAYYDDSTHLVGEPNVNCVLLNLAAPPFNSPSVRRAAAMAVNRAQYAKVIDVNVNPVANGLFTPGSPFYSKTSYPSYNPTEAKKLVKAAEKSGGSSAVSFTIGTINSSYAVREQEYLQQAFQDVGFKVSTNIVQQDDLINDALAGTFQALTWSQFGAVDPDLNYIFWSSTTILTKSLAVNMTRNKDPQIEAALQLGRTSTNPAVRDKAYKKVNERMAVDIPYLWLDRAVTAIISTPQVQNWNNPTTVSGAPAFGMISGSIWPTQVWIS
jgi:peptide/nickel transport system substrate-binding protein